MLFKKTIYLPAILLFLSFLTHFYLLGTPREVVFDEVHFGGFSSKYITGQYFFDNHPPLGKLIIALGGKIGGYSDYVAKNKPFDFSSIGNATGDVPIFWFRFFPALAGMLFPFVIFLFLRVIKINIGTAFFAGILILLENALLVQSRFILLDIFILFFGFLGLYLFFLAREKKYHPLLIIPAGIFLSASFCVKWTGATYLFIAFGVIAWDLLAHLLQTQFFLYLFKNKKNKSLLISFKKILTATITLIATPILLYLGCFYVHFSLLNNFTPSDVPNGKLPFFEKFIELNKQMYYSHSGLTATHPDESKPLQWLTLKKPVHYWLKSEPQGTAQIIFFGNPFIWLCGMLGVLCFPLFWTKIKLNTEIKLVLFFGFWINFLPFLLIKRLLFLYHYLNALVFSIILFSLIFFIFFSQKKFFLPVISILLFFCLIGFLLFSNFTYGLPLSNGWQKSTTDFFMYSK